MLINYVEITDKKQLIATYKSIHRTTETIERVEDTRIHMNLLNMLITYNKPTESILFIANRMFQLKTWQEAMPDAPLQQIEATRRAVFIHSDLYGRVIETMVHKIIALEDEEAITVLLRNFSKWSESNAFEWNNLLEIKDNLGRSALELAKKYKLNSTIKGLLTPKKPEAEASHIHSTKKPELAVPVVEQIRSVPSTTTEAIKKAFQQQLNTEFKALKKDRPSELAYLIARLTVWNEKSAPAYFLDAILSKFYGYKEGEDFKGAFTASIPLFETILSLCRKNSLSSLQLDDEENRQSFTAALSCAIYSLIKNSCSIKEFADWCSKPENTNYGMQIKQWLDKFNRIFSEKGYTELLETKTKKTQLYKNIYQPLQKASIRVEAPIDNPNGSQTIATEAPSTPAVEEPAPVSPPEEVPVITAIDKKKDSEPAIEEITLPVIEPTITELAIPITASPPTATTEEVFAPRDQAPEAPSQTTPEVVRADSPPIMAKSSAPLTEKNPIQAKIQPTRPQKKTKRVSFNETPQVILIKPTVLTEPTNTPTPKRIDPNAPCGSIKILKRETPLNRETPPSKQGVNASDPTKAAQPLKASKKKIAAATISFKGLEFKTASILPQNATPSRYENDTFNKPTQKGDYIALPIKANLDSPRKREIPEPAHSAPEIVLPTAFVDPAIVSATATTFTPPKTMTLADLMEYTKLHSKPGDTAASHSQAPISAAPSQNVAEFVDPAIVTIKTKPVDRLSTPFSPALTITENTEIVSVAQQISKHYWDVYQAILTNNLSFFDDNVLTQLLWLLPQTPASEVQNALYQSLPTDADYNTVLFLVNTAVLARHLEYLIKTQQIQNHPYLFGMIGPTLYNYSLLQPSLPLTERILTSLLLLDNYLSNPSSQIHEAKAIQQSLREALNKYIETLTIEVLAALSNAPRLAPLLNSYCESVALEKVKSTTNLLSVPISCERNAEAFLPKPVLTFFQQLEAFCQKTLPKNPYAISLSGGQIWNRAIDPRADVDVICFITASSLPLLKKHFSDLQSYLTRQPQLNAQNVFKFHGNNAGNTLTVHSVKYTLTNPDSGDSYIIDLSLQGGVDTSILDLAQMSLLGRRLSTDALSIFSINRFESFGCNNRSMSFWRYNPNSEDFSHALYVLSKAVHASYSSYFIKQMANFFSLSFGDNPLLKVTLLRPAIEQYLNKMHKKRYTVEHCFNTLTQLKNSFIIQAGYAIEKTNLDCPDFNPNSSDALSFREIVTVDIETFQKHLEAKPLIYQDREQNSIFHIVAETGHHGLFNTVCCKLRERGASDLVIATLINTPNGQGLTALDIANQQNPRNEKTIQLMKDIIAACHTTAWDNLLQECAKSLSKKPAASEPALLSTHGMFAKDRAASVAIPAPAMSTHANPGAAEIDKTVSKPN